MSFKLDAVQRDLTPMRHASRAAAKPRFDLFDGHGFHTVFAAHAPPTPEGDLAMRR